MPDESCCANCGEPLKGEFCHACGQRCVDLDAGIWVLLEEALAETFEADGRLASTFVPFFFRPGQLVTEFMAGRRVHYTSPVRIYVFAVLVCFFSFGLATNGADTELRIDDDGVYFVPKGNVETGAPPELEASEPSELSELSEAGGIARHFQHGLDKLRAMNPTDAGQHLTEKIYDVVPKVLLVLVPLLALVLKLAWWRRSMVEHLLFSLNLHSLGMIVLALSIQSRSDLVAISTAFVAVSLHGVIGARRIYESSWLGTIVRSTIVGIVYGVLLILGVLASVLLAIAMA